MRVGWLSLGLLIVLPLASAQEAPACAAGQRLLDNDYLLGEPVCIPENPQRVVALEMSAAELTLFTDKTLLGTNTWVEEELPVMVPELEPTFGGLETYGYPADLEAVLLAKPDIILAVQGDIDVAAASEIAPVVLGKDVVNSDWQAGFSLWSDALNVPDVYAELQENYDVRVTELQNALGDARKTTEVSVVSLGTYGIWLWYVDSAPGYVLQDVGLARPPSQDYQGTAQPDNEISEERLDLADGDEIFYFNYATADPATLNEENTAVDALTNTPLWQSLSGVRSGHAYEVGGHWWRAQTYMLASKVLDDLFAHLTDKPSPTPALSPASVSQ